MSAVGGRFVAVIGMKGRASARVSAACSLARNVRATRRRREKTPVCAMDEAMKKRHPPTPALRGPRRHLPRLLASLLLLSLWLVKGEAWAISIGTPAPEELHDGLPLTASSADCNAGASFTWNLVDLMANDSIEVWASESQDCSLSASRTGGDATCVRIKDPIGVSEMTREVTVTVPEITGAVPDITDCVDSATGNTTRTVDVYFLVNVSGDVPMEDVAFESLTLDFIGPAAPTLNSVGPAGATSLTASWSPPQGDAGLRFNLYCQQATAGSEGESCEADGLVPGEMPPGDLLCSDGAIDGAKGSTTESLTQGTVYAVGVAGIDNIDNPGVLSNLRCAAPEPLFGFGDAVGEVDGLCSISSGPQPGPLRWGYLLVGLGVASTLVRRRGGRR